MFKHPITRERAIDLLANISMASDDPDTQTACLLVTPGGSLLTWSANCVPTGVIPLPERLQRPEKYKFVMHAERRAIAKAAKDGLPLLGSTLYLNWFPCSDCAASLIQAGVRRVVANRRQYDARRGDARYGFEEAMTMLTEAGVQVDWYVS